MPDSFLFNKTFRVLEKSMDVSAKRHSMITSNIANVNTVGYQPKDIDFQKTLEKELLDDSGSMIGTHDKHYRYSGDTGSIHALKRGSGDETNPDPVNIDTEMTNLAENNIKYRTSAEILLRKIAKLRYVITEGGR